MTREELKQELDRINIPKSYYSLYDDLEPDRWVIYHNYAKWEVFYFDEKGKRDRERIFKSEDEACQFLLQYFIKAQNSARRDGDNSYGV